MKILVIISFAISFFFALNIVAIDRLTTSFANLGKRRLARSTALIVPGPVVISVGFRKLQIHQQPHLGVNNNLLRRGGYIDREHI